MSDGIAGVLGDHQRRIDDGSCWCGAWPPDARDETWMAHVAAAVADFLTSEAVVEVAADRHQWQGGYFCTCGHELNSPAGFSRHLARAALAAAAGVGES